MGLHVIEKWLLCTRRIENQTPDTSLQPGGFELQVSTAASHLCPSVCVCVVTSAVSSFEVTNLPSAIGFDFEKTPRWP